MRQCVQNPSCGRLADGLTLRVADLLVPGSDTTPVVDLLPRDLMALLLKGIIKTNRTFMCLIQGGSWTGRSSGKQIRGKQRLLLQTRGTTAKAEKVPSLRGAGSLAHGAIVAGVGRLESEGAEQTRGRERTWSLLAQLKQSQDEWGSGALLSWARGLFLSKRAGGLRECQVSLPAPCILISMYTRPLGNGSAKPGSTHNACQRKMDRATFLAYPLRARRCAGDFGFIIEMKFT